MNRLLPAGRFSLAFIQEVDPNAPGPAYAENCAALGTNQPGQDGIAIGNPTLPLPGKSLPTVSRDCKRLPFPPNVTITKILNNCCMSSVGGAYSEVCEFSVSVKNNGTATYSGPLTMYDEDPNSDPSDPGLGSLGRTTRSRLVQGKRKLTRCLLATISPEQSLRIASRCPGVRPIPRVRPAQIFPA